jgi:hypothetical protein
MSRVRSNLPPEVCHKAGGSIANTLPSLNVDSSFPLGDAVEHQHCQKISSIETLEQMVSKIPNEIECKVLAALQSLRLDIGQPRTSSIKVEEALNKTVMELVNVGTNIVNLLEICGKSSNNISSTRSTQEGVGCLNKWEEANRHLQLLYDPQSRT